MKVDSKIKKVARFIESKTAFAVDTAIKVLTAVVLGALVLSGLYGLFTGVIKPQTEGHIDAMYEYTGSGDLNGPFEGGTGGGGAIAAPELATGAAVPTGCTYTPEGGTVLNAGQKMPSDVKTGDIFTTADYEYHYNEYRSDGRWKPTSQNGWGVVVKDETKIKYEPLYSEINGKAVTNMDCTFFYCASLTEAPVIPNSVTSLYDTFRGCTSLTTAPVIPSSVTKMGATFKGCTSLTTAPAIPDSVTILNFAFDGCTALTTAPVIPSSVTDMAGTFCGCTSLTTAPVIPDSVRDMGVTFFECTSLATAPVIPSSVTNMDSTFYRCKSLTEAPVIPNSVTNMNVTFYECTSLTTGPVIPSSVMYMRSTFEDCTSLKGTIEINAIPRGCDRCFSNAGSTSGCITLTGSSTKLNELAATNTQGHVVVV